MALTLTAPASSENDTIILSLMHDNDLLGENPQNDFSLRRADNNAVIGSNRTLNQLSADRQPYRGELTVTQTEAYTGEVYVQIPRNAFRDRTTLGLIPSRPLNSNRFRFRFIPAPDAPTNFAGTVTFESARLTWTSDAAETYEIRRDGGTWEDATSPHDVTGLSPETSYDWEVRVKARGFAPAGNAASLTLTTPVEPPRPAAPANFSVVVTSVAARAMWEELPGETYEVRVDAGEWEDATSPHLFMGLTPNDKYTFQVRVRANADVRAGVVASITITTLAAGVLAIELIAEQFILVRTRNYSLEIDIYGNPDGAEVSGLQEGFYQDWDGVRNKLYIKSEFVERLTTQAVWTVTARKGNQVVTATIIYNVTEAVPVIIDPGTFTLYQNHDFDEFVRVRNAPTIVTGYSTLVGLKSQPTTLEVEGRDPSAEPLSGISTNGRLLSTARIPFDRFNIDYYAENEHGSDELSVPVNIVKGTFYRSTLDYVARARTVSLTILLPHNQVPAANLRIIPSVDVGGDRFSVRYTTTIGLRAGTTQGGGAGNRLNTLFANNIRATTSGIPDTFGISGQVFSVSYTDVVGDSQSITLAVSDHNGNVFKRVGDFLNVQWFTMSTENPVTFTLPDRSTRQYTEATSTSPIGENEVRDSVVYSITQQSVVTIPAANYGVEGYTRQLRPIGRGFTTGTISFAFMANGRTQNMVFRNFNIYQDYNNTIFTRIT